MRIIDIVITIIKIAVPIILILTVMINYMSAVKDNDSEALSKTNKLFVRKIIAAILIFLIPTFVKLLADISSNTVDYAQCISNATIEGINNAYRNMAQKYIEISKKSLTESDYKTAVNYIESNIKDEGIKEQLLNELSIVKKYLDLKERILKLKTNYDKNEYNKLKDDINSFPDEKMKEKLLSEFDKIVIPIEGHPEGKPEKSYRLSYVVHSPSSVRPGMPLVLYLHGDGGGSSNGSSPFLSAAKKYFKDDLPFILITPNGGMWAETNGRLAELKSIIDKECEKYQCDTSRISIAGHSRGSIGTWHMINNYPKFFYSAVPVSCGSYSINPKNFVGTKIRAYAGTLGKAESGYNSAMRSNVSIINNAGGNATFIALDGAGHGDTPGLAFTKDTLLWMIK
jgi:hypothetical protein